MAQCGAKDEAEVGRGVSCAEAALVFLKRHVQLPMQLVLDAPVTANRFGKAAGGELLAQDVVPRFDGLLPVASCLIEGHADRDQTAGKLEDLQQFRDCGDLVALVIDGHLAQRDPSNRHPVAIASYPALRNRPGLALSRP